MQTVEFVQYNYIGEFAGILMAGLLLFAMLYTKPRRTFVYKYVFRGVIISLAAIVVQISILITANSPELYYSRFLFTIQLFVFLLLYNGILFCIFSYVNFMSIVRRNQRKEFVIMYGVLSFLYIFSMILEFVARGLFEVDMGYVDITHFTRFYCIAGIICAVICFEATITNKRHISKVVFDAVKLFVPVDIVLLIIQIVMIEKEHAVFSAVTYVPILALGYLFFHSNPYDELTGCQNKYALAAFLNKNAGKRKFYLTYSVLMSPPIEDYSKIDLDNMYKGVGICRSLEAIGNKIRLYSFDDTKYINVIDVADEKEARRYADRTRAIFDEAKSSSEVPVNYLMITGEINPILDNEIKVRQFFQFIAERFEGQNSSHFYFVKPSDYDDFAEHYEIVNTLKDIRNRLDFEDDRVIVYAQPIYSVDSGSFRVAEALMRLKVGDRIISPDRFIGIAEANGCIHALTSIILNKVCGTIKQIEDFYDFDAISINCSSKELSQTNMHVELMEIIDRYDIDVSKIRFEVTESAMFEDYDVANENMKILTKAGIQFYLDDFGTGYSSLERVMDCPFRTIKFDKTILYKALDDDKMSDIMSYMIEVFKKNGYITLVEGVEDENQNQYSMEKGFDFIQGYHYAKPEPILEVKKYFRRKN